MTMYPRTEYEMTQDDLDAILDASKPTPAMFLSGGTPMFDTPQENANRAWQRLGERLGFDHMTVRPIAGTGQRFFSAVPNETADQREARLAREAQETKQRRIVQLTQEIAEREAELAGLKP